LRDIILINESIDRFIASNHSTLRALVILTTLCASRDDHCQALCAQRHSLIRTANRMPGTLCERIATHLHGLLSSQIKNDTSGSANWCYCQVCFNFA